MGFFVATMTHPDGEGWTRHAAAHVDYLQGLIERGVLRAWGPLKGTPLRAGLLVFTVPTRADAEALVAADPFAREGLIVSLTIEKGDPLFEAFAAESSGVLQGIARF